MVELEFWDEQRGVTLARVSGRDPATIPATGDGVYIPAADQSGVYVHIQVNSRQFYYSQEGDLVTIRILCAVL
ncbi:MAG TPA: hypothetical protein VFF52_01630 [Isosphaeraceae bacterium]|nr:hypothetical protein [Isosphaeraceae bacterium]